MTIYPDSRIDTNNAAQVEKEIFEALDGRDAGVESVVIDAKDLKYISSAGLRVLMKLRKSIGKPLPVLNVSREVYDIFETTGFTELLDVKRALREVSVEGCAKIGEGFFGTVYRLDDDTIVKVYRTPDAIEKIQNEIKMAKTAFLKGIQTAIAYDMVRVGDYYGSVFEMIPSKTFNDMIIEAPDNVDGIVKQYVALMKTVHGTQMDPGTLPSAREKFSGYLEAVRNNLKDVHYTALKELLEGMPESSCLVHGDFQMKNVMLMDGEPMLIDMDTLSTGEPVFDLASLYTAYQLFEEDEPGNTRRFLGYEAEVADHIWEKILAYYLGDMPSAQRDETVRQIRLLASVWFLFVVSQAEPGDALRELRIRRTLEHLDELLASGGQKLS